MSRINIVLLLSIYILTACAYIDNGTSVAPEKVSLEQLTGCYYREIYQTHTYPPNELYCGEYCFSNDSAYYEGRAYHVTFAEDSSRIFTLSGSESYVDQAIRLEPQKDGNLFLNLQITGSRNYNFTDDVMFLEKDGIKYLDIRADGSVDFSTNGWTLCAF